MSICYSLACHTCKLTVWCGEEINEHEGGKGEVDLYHLRNFCPAASFLGKHIGHSLGFYADECPGFFEGYRRLDNDDPQLPVISLNVEELDWVRRDPSLCHALDRITDD